MKIQRMIALLLVLTLGLLPTVGDSFHRFQSEQPGMLALGDAAVGWTAVGAGAWQAKVEPAALQTASSGESEFLVLLKEQADLSRAAMLSNKEERGKAVYEALHAAAQRSQDPIIRELEASGLEHKSFWIVNMILVRGGPDALERLAKMEQVERIFNNPHYLLQTLSPDQQIDAAYAVYAASALNAAQAFSTGQALPAAPDAIQWNITQVNADDVWNAGYTGQGVVVGGQDTGYQWDHPALKASYRGWNGSAADHNYNWHDAVHTRDVRISEDNTLCPYNSPVPCDDTGHGTHTMGIISGSDGDYKIGMAPGVQWIGCRNMDRGFGTPATYAECYQWFVAPTDLNGENPRPDLAPDIINNSWGCPPTEGCTDPDILAQVVENVRAAGILTVHSAGNTGPSCSTIREPASIYDASFTVGATNLDGLITYYSGRGPVTVDGSGRLKPDVTAPGGGILSSIPNNAYATLSGTSMAAPHAAGQAALLLSAQPALRGNVDSLEALIAQTAVPTPSALCDPAPGAAPNNVYGWGRIDAWAALNGHALSVSKSMDPIAIRPGEALTYTIHVTHTAITTPTTNLVIRDRLPAGTTFLSASEGYILQEGEIRWEIASLAANASLSVQVVVSTSTTSVGDIINAEYGASSQDRSFIAGEPVVMPLDPERSVSLAADSDWLSSPGSTRSFQVALTNTGAAPDILIVQVSSSSNWAQLEGENRISLLDGQTAWVTLRVDIPPGTPIGAADTITVQVSSWTDPLASAAQTITLRSAGAYFLPLVLNSLP